jgi:hypothetical protein
MITLRREKKWTTLSIFGKKVSLGHFKKFPYYHKSQPQGAFLERQEQNVLARRKGN